MVEVLIKYFQALFPRSNLIGVQKVAGGVGRRLTEEMLEVLNGSFTEDEVTLALKQTQRQKHQGKMALPHCFINNSGIPLDKMLLKSL